jgi:type I restriction enzyme S subunit
VMEAELPKSWLPVKLGEISEITYGKGLSTKQLLPEGYPVFGANGVIGFYDRYLYEFPQLLISCRGANSGTINLSPKESFITNNSLIVGFSVCRESLVSLLYYFLQAVDKSKLITGTAQPQVTINNAVELAIHLPPLNEQSRIVAKIEELFSEIDAGVASLKTARAQLGVYRQSLLKQAFEGKLTEKWRAQNPDELEPAEQLLERIRSERETRFLEELESWEVAYTEWQKDGEHGKKPPKPKKHKELESGKTETLSVIPKRWNQLNLSQLVLALRQGWSPKCEGHPASEGQWSVMTTTAIQPIMFQPFQNKVLPAGLFPRPWITVKSDDILITRAGPRSRCGVICRVREDADQLMLCDKAYRLRFSKNDISAEFVELLLNSYDFSRKIENLKTGISDSGVNITQTGFLQLVVPVPSLPEQQEIVRILEEQFTAIEQNEAEIDVALQRAEALRQSILKKAFAGKLVPQDPNDVPANVLLERIRAEREADGEKLKAKKTAAKKAIKKRARKQAAKK